MERCGASRRISGSSDLTDTTIIPLAGFTADRAAHRRGEAAWIDAAFASDAAMVLLMREGQPLLEAGANPARAHLLWLGPQAGQLAPNATRVFLGLTPKGSPMFALDVAASFQLSSSLIAGLGAFEDFRTAASGLSPHDCGAAATARALFEWHQRHGFCARCGAASVIEEAGWKRRCPVCDAEHFPRVDPVVIMLATYGDKCLLGRQPTWRPRMWSCLAGFVEPGETFEQAAARELMEEAGVAAKPSSARYLFCQPWPFPSSLMIGMTIDADSDAITVDGRELEQARWFTRDEARAIMADAHADVSAPNPIAVAHHILKAWVEER